jgi:hypothetical protein
VISGSVIVYPKIEAQLVRLALGWPLLPVAVLTWHRDAQGRRRPDGAHARHDHRPFAWLK